MSRRSRIVAFGAAGLLVLAGAVAAAIPGGGTGQMLALVLIGAGLVAITGLAFLEVGLSEDRARARERKRAGRAGASRSRRTGRRPVLDRSRGRRRRLR